MSSVRQRMTSVLLELAREIAEAELAKLELLIRSACGVATAKKNSNNSGAKTPARAPTKPQSARPPARRARGAKDKVCLGPCGQRKPLGDYPTTKSGTHYGICRVCHGAKIAAGRSGHGARGGRARAAQLKDRALSLATKRMVRCTIEGCGHLVWSTKATQHAWDAHGKAVPAGRLADFFVDPDVGVAEVRDAA